MPRLILLFLLGVTGCSDSGDRRAQPVERTSSIVGLYERAGIPGEPGRICVAEEGGIYRFGLKSSYEGPESCTMKGRITRAGSSLILRIDGDPACGVSASVTPAGLALAQPKGAECGYYCGGDTELDGGTFVKVGGTNADAREAVDIAGEPLCP